MKKFISYLRENNILAAVLIIVFCSIIYIFREKIKLQEQTITFINLIIMGILALVLYNSVRKQYTRKSYVICILSLFFVFNKYYDKEVFSKTFRFKFSNFLVVSGALIIFWIIYPWLKNLFAKTSSLLGNWTQKKIEEEKNLKEKRFKEKKLKDKIKTKEENKVVCDETVISENENEEKKKNSSIGNIGLFVIVFATLLLIPIGLLAFTIFAQHSNIMEKITYDNISTVVLSLVITFVFLVFVTGIALSLLIKWYQIIKDIINEQHKGEMYFVYACGLFFVSQYIFVNYSYATDDVVDLLLNGKLFTFPLILSVLIPVFLI